MKTCPHCNTSCEDSDIVCSNCGYLFSAENIPYPPDGEADKQPSQQTQQPYQQSQQSYQPPVNYPQPGPEGFQTAPNPQKTNGLAIASLVLGIVGILFCWCYGFGILPSIPGVILGIISLGQIKKNGQGGKGIAIAGLILSILGGLLSIIMIFVFVHVLTSPEGKNLISQYSHMYSSSSVQ